MPVTVMLSIAGWTKTYVGTLLAPRAVAVTRAMPALPALQMLKVISQCPAQATPLGETFTIDVSLDVKLMATRRVVPEVV